MSGKQTQREESTGKLCEHTSDRHRFRQVPPGPGRARNFQKEIKRGYMRFIHASTERRRDLPPTSVQHSLQLCAECCFRRW